MSLNNIIRNVVINESIKNHDLGIEKQIVENRLLFSISNAKFKNNSLEGEKYNLLNSGYDIKIVEETYKKLKNNIL
jgi:hypothetical protein